MVPNSKEHRIPVVYLITCRVNGKIYVGSAKDFYVRFRGYKAELQRKEPRSIIRAMDKHGLDSFEFSVLEYLDHPTQCVRREQYWMDKLQPFGKQGYNEHRIAGSWLGCKHTPTAIAKMRAAQLLCGPKTSLRMSRPVIQIDKQTLKPLKEWASLKEASAAYNIDPSCISLVCNRYKSVAVGFYWAHKDTYNPLTFKPLSLKQRGHGWIERIRPVRQINSDGTLVKMWDNARLAAQALGVTSGDIGKCCAGKRKRAHGYRWEYETDPIYIEQAKERLRKEWIKHA
jgi:group I intron endonuclease